MAEQKKKPRQDGSCDKKRNPDSFFVQELKARAEIKQKSKAFKTMVDVGKEKELRRIDAESKRREDSISTDVSALDAALNTDDAEMIKAALKNFHL